MQNKFTQKAQSTLNKAMSEAGSLGHSYIGSEHLLLGLASERDSIASRILLARGLSPTVIKSSIIEIMGEGEKCKVNARDLTEHAHSIIERSAAVAQRKGCTYIGTEHLLTALLEENGCMGVKIIEASGIPISAIKSDINAHGSTFSCQGKTSSVESSQDTAKDNKSKRLSSALSLYSRDLTQFAKNGMTDPTLEREEETERIIQILSRRQKNNPCLIGEPGVGKTAIVEGLARRLSEDSVPPCLSGKRILSLDLASMIAGAKYRGEFEERIKQILNDVEKSPDIILFIDELHVITGAGAAEGAVDAANILKPALSRGGVRLIGATTPEEYKKHIERDTALERRFQSVYIDEPCVEATIKILKGLRPRYEAHHKIKISDEAITAATKLSHRYIPERFLPDKAIDIIDEAASKMSIAISRAFPDVAPLERELATTKAQKEDAVFSQDYSLASELRDKEIRLKEKLDEQKRLMKKKKNAELFTLGELQVAEWVTSITGIPTGRLLGGEAEAIKTLEARLAKRIVGQDKAIASVCSALRRARLGLVSPNRPMGSFIFIGNSGVGKTELAHAVAEELLGSKKALIRFDMSEFMEKHSISKLIGSPPGYIGYGEGGRLTERVRKRPYSVVLFDEIEKAHPDIFNILLQVLEDGILTDSEGRQVNFCNTVIIMTSNAGASEGGKILGFSSDIQQKAEESMRTALNGIFAPEFLNRVDEIIVFDELKTDSLEKIAQNMLSSVSLRIREMGLDVSFDASVAHSIAERARLDKGGARNIRRMITRSVEDNISMRIINGNILPDTPCIFTAEDMLTDMNILAKSASAV